MAMKYYLTGYNDEMYITTRDYDSKEEAYDNKEFLERYYGMHVNLKVVVEG